MGGEHGWAGVDDGRPVFDEAFVRTGRHEPSASERHQDLLLGCADLAVADLLDADQFAATVAHRRRRIRDWVILGVVVVVTAAGGWLLDGSPAHHAHPAGGTVPHRAPAPPHAAG